MAEDRCNRLWAFVLTLISSPSLSRKMPAMCVDTGPLIPFRVRRHDDSRVIISFRRLSLVPFTCLRLIERNCTNDPSKRRSSLVARRTRDLKGEGSNPCRSGGKNFFSRGYFLCWLLFFGILSVTAVARKKIPVILPKVQVAGYSPNKTVNMAYGYMVSSESAQRRQQFHVAPAM